mgnify:FL=1
MQATQNRSNNAAVVNEVMQPQYKEVALNKCYVSNRNGQKTYAFPVEVKKKEVVLKRSLTDKHSFSESRAKFDKFFVLLGN